MATLVVIDMQPNFYYANYVVDNVLDEIEKAKLSRHAIITLEYDPPSFGSTMQSIRRALTKYHRHAKCIKYGKGGSKEVYHEIVSNDFDAMHLRICGVNTDCCVKETTLGLAKMLPYSRIEVVKRACSCPENTFDWIDNFNLEVQLV